MKIIYILSNGGIRLTGEDQSTRKTSVIAPYFLTQNDMKVPALIRRCDDLPATITHVPVAAVLVLNTPDDGGLRPKHIE